MKRKVWIFVQHQLPKRNSQSREPNRKAFAYEPWNMAVKLDAHGMRPMRFLSACVWFHDVTSFSDASGMVCVRVGTCFYIGASGSLLW